MELDKKLLVNKYGISDEQFKIIVSIIEAYLKKINYMSDVNDKGNAEIISLLGVSSELLPVLKDQDEWLDRIFIMMQCMKKRIENDEISSISLHEGLANIGVFSSILHKNTKSFSRFLDSLNKLLCSSTEMLYKKFMEENRVMTQNFDVMLGFSGIGNSLLQYSDNGEVQAALRLICKYLVSISDYQVIDGKRLPGWYINLKNEPWYDLYSLYEDGYINYSMSHGIGGPLAFLTSTLEKGIYVEGQKEAVERIIDEYLYVNRTSNGRWWSGIVSRKDYENQYFPEVTDRQSWCYGNLTILITLYRTAKYLGMKELKNRALSKLKEIALRPIEQYHLHTPIICHGYAGTMTMFRILYEETGEPEFYNVMVRLLSHTLQSFKPDSMYGFQNVRFSKSPKEIYEDDVTFLNGASGVIMELSAWIKTSTDFEVMLLLKS